MLPKLVKKTLQFLGTALVWGILTIGLEANIVSYMACTWVEENVSLKC